MPKSFPQLTDEHGGTLLFTSSQDDILQFLQSPVLVDYGGMCLALVLMWLKKDTCKERPNQGIVNKVTANNLQNKMEASWGGFATAVSTGKEFLGKNFWWRSESMHPFTKWSDPAPYLQNDPGAHRDGLHLLVLYFNHGPAHAIGAWRFPSGAMALYDPNHGACAVSAERFSNFLANFIYELYKDDIKGFAVCSFWAQG